MLDYPWSSVPGPGPALGFVPYEVEKYLEVFKTLLARGLRTFTIQGGGPEAGAFLRKPANCERNTSSNCLDAGRISSKPASTDCRSGRQCPTRGRSFSFRLQVRPYRRR